MSITYKITLGIFTVMMLANVSFGAVELTVIPEDGAITGVIPGGTINYTATVVVTEPLTGQQEEEFSIVNTTTELPMPGWFYNFDPSTVTLQGNQDESKSSRLTITVPIDAKPGNYKHTVYATGYDEEGRSYGISTELDPYIYDVPVIPVPELSTVFLTSAGLLGMILVSRNKGKK